VGVKAPGSPTSKMDFLAAKSFKLCFLGGNPRCSSTSGMASPTDAKVRRAMLDRLEADAAALASLLMVEEEEIALSIISVCMIYE